MKYPHRTSLRADGPVDWTCRCGASSPIYSAEVAINGWGDRCPAAMLDRIAELEGVQVSIHKAVAAALEERAKGLETKADTLDAYAQSCDDVSWVAALRHAADIVRGKS